MTALVPIRIEVHPAVGAPVVIRNDRTTPLTLVSFREPARQPRVEYAPTSHWQDGEMPLSLSLQQSLLGFDVAARGAASESAAQAAYAALDTATYSLAVPVHVVWHDHTQIWTCHAGSRTPATDRDYVNLRDHDAVWSVSLPCHPIPTAP
jgi:hypothetical protein